MHVAAGMFGDNALGGLLERGVSRSHPEQQAAMVKLLLEIFRVTLLHELAKHDADEAAKFRADQAAHEKHREGAAGRERRAGRRSGADVDKTANDRALFLA